MNLQHRTSKRLVSLSLAGAFTIGAIAMASPAAANSWSGSIPCPSSQAINAVGTSHQPGNMTVRAGSITWSMTGNGPLQVRGWRGEQSWAVHGPGASSAVAFCGNPFV